MKFGLSVKALVSFHIQMMTNNKNIKELQLNKFDHYLSSSWTLASISNRSNMKTHIIEIQYGEDCIESDIERLDKT